MASSFGEYNSLVTLLSSAALVLEDASGKTSFADRGAALTDVAALLKHVSLRVEDLLNNGSLRDSLPPHVCRHRVDSLIDGKAPAKETGPISIKSTKRQIRYRDGRFGPIRHIGEKQGILQFR